MDLLRHGGMDGLFAGIRVPSTLGTFLRSFTRGHVRHQDSARMTATVQRAITGIEKSAWTPSR